MNGLNWAINGRNFSYESQQLGYEWKNWAMIGIIGL